MSFEFSLTNLASLVFIFGSSLALPAYAAGGDPDPNADYMKQLEAENRPPLTTWASRHRSFPQIDSQEQNSSPCFMQTEDGRVLNLEAICGSSVERNPQNTPRDTPKI